MNWNILASVKVDDITRTRSAGRPVNTHVTPARAPNKPNYELMQRMVHDRTTRVEPRTHGPAA